MVCVPRHRTQMPGLKVALGLLLIAAWTSSCGRGGAHRVQLSARDSGSSVRLHVGETFDLTLGERSPGPWTLGYPRSLLSLKNEERGKGEFLLLARQVGTAKVLAWPRGGCGSGPLHGPARKCPLTGRMTGIGDRRVHPFVVTVHIVKK